MFETTTEKQSDRRIQIINAAHDLIAEKGFEGLRVREVAERVGINIATLHYYFSSKEDLIRAIVQTIISELDRVPAMDGANNVSPKVVLSGHFQHVLNQTYEYPDRFIVLNELFVRASRDDEVHRVLSETDVSWHGFLVPLLEAGRADGSFRSDLKPEETAVIITSFFKGLGLQLSLGAERVENALNQLEVWIVGN